MNKKIPIIIFTILLAASCNATQTIEQETPPVIKQYDYSDFIDSHISWESIFSIPFNHYYIYIYSKTCGHCNNVKKEIFFFANEKGNEFYFVEYNDNIPIGYDVTFTIGKTNYKDVYILGTPTILLIQDGLLIENLAGERNVLNYILR